MSRVRPAAPAGAQHRPARRRTACPDRAGEGLAAGPDRAGAGSAAGSDRAGEGLAAGPDRAGDDSGARPDGAGAGSAAGPDGPGAGPGAVPPLARSALNRAAHLRTDATWLAEAWSRALVLVVDAAGGGRALIRPRGDRVELVLLSSAQVPVTAPADRLFLGLDGGGLDGGPVPPGQPSVPIFAVVGELRPIAGARPANLRDVGELLDDRDAGVLTSAVALVNWHGRAGFSPASGRPTTPAEGGWARTDADGLTYWPRTDPAVIALIHDGAPGPDGRCLLGSNTAWAGRGPRRFSCLAGFVEAGESAEAAVVREVAEEVGVTVTAVTYVSSQSWPFPGSLMLGFTALADPEQPIHTDPTEIAEARWFTRREIATALAAGAAIVVPGGAPAGAIVVPGGAPANAGTPADPDGRAGRSGVDGAVGASAATTVTGGPGTPEQPAFGLPMAASIAHYMIERWAHPERGAMPPPARRRGA